MMSEWSVPWDYIDSHWTPRQIRTFGRALEDRLKGRSTSKRTTEGGRTVTHESNPIRLD